MSRRTRSNRTCLSAFELQQLIPITAILILLAWVCGDVPQAYSQETTAAILGTVTDTTGAAVPGAAVTATNEATGRTYTTTSSPDGNYEFPVLPITGTYRIDVEVKGFEKFEQVKIVLRVNDRVRVDPKLKVGAVTQTVEVTGMPPQVNTTTTSLGDVIDNQRVTELPLNGRNAAQLSELAAGVTALSAPTVFTWRGGNYLSVNGGREDDNDILIDGAHYEGAYFNNGLNLASPDAMQEFKLITNTYSAEYGRNAGSVLNSVIKSGTNQIHGSAFEFLRNTDLNARNFFLNSPGAQTAQLVQNQFGGTAGGPIIKNKFFIFGSYQGLRIAQQEIATSAPPTAAERDGLFTVPAGQSLINPATGLPFPQNGSGQFVVPTTSFNPVANYLVSHFLTSYGGQSLLPGPSGSLTVVAHNPTTVNQTLLKGDANITGNNLLNVTFMDDHTSRYDPVFASNVPGYRPYTPTSKVFFLSLNDTHTIKPNLLNQLRLSYTHHGDLLGCGAQQDATDFGQTDYIPDFIGPVTPDYTVAGRVSLSGNLCNIYESDVTRQGADTITWVHGRHTIKAGAEIDKDLSLGWFGYGDGGFFTSNGSVTGNSMADFMLGQVSNYARLGPAYNYTVSWEGGGFGQDDWKVNRKLTLNLGLRYYTQQPWLCPNGRCGPGIGIPGPGYFGTFIPGAHTQRYANEPTGILFEGDPGIPAGIYKQDWNGWEPRIGLAWDPTGSGRTAVRLSYGVFQDQVFGWMLSVANNIQPYIINQEIPYPVGGLSSPFEGQPNPWPFTLYKQATPQFVLPMTVNVVDTHDKPPLIQGWTLDIEHQVTEAFMVELAYTGKDTTHLQDNTDDNPPNYIPGIDPSTGLAYSTGANVNTRRQYYPNFAQISNFLTGGRAWYNSLQLTTRYRFSHGLTFQTAYTYSKALDDNSAYTGAITEQSPFCYLSCERGLSDFDLTHVFSASLVYDFPTPFKDVAGFTGKLERGLLGGWETSEITRLTSGFPFSCVTGTNNLLNGLNNDRCDTIGNWKLSGRSHGAEVAEWFNTAAFETNAIGQSGTSQRNFLRGPHQFNSDFALFKNFKLGERWGTVQFRSEFFNVFNLVQFNNPVNNLAAGPTFGQITSANNPRLIQFALKYVF